MLNMQLTNLKVEFQAGKTKQHLCDLKHLTSAIQILQTLSGLPIELTDELVQTHTAQKRNFPLRISSVNLTKSAVSCGFGHIY